MAEQWHDINDPGFFKAAEPQQVEAAEEYETDTLLAPKRKLPRR